MAMVDSKYRFGGSVVSLPVELEMMIVDGLEGDIKTLMRMRSLCRRWKWLVDNNKRIWQSLPLKLPSRYPAEAEKW